MTKKLLDKPTSTVEELAKKYKVSVLEVKKQLLKGIKVEKEHTDHPKIAREIALDHLGERLDYYTKLDKAHLEEETGTGGVRGLGYVTGDPGIDPVTQYINTNAMSYVDENGNKLAYIKKAHADLHNQGLGFKFFDPTKTKTFSNFINEATTTAGGLGGKHSPQGEGEKYLENNVKNTDRDSEIREKHAVGVHHSLHADNDFNAFKHTNVKGHSNRELTEAKIRVKEKLDELGGMVGYEGISDPPPKGRTNDQLEEGPKLDKAKKLAMATMTAANMYTMSDVAGRATEGGQGSPRGDVVRAASAMPGAVGWGATVLHYGNKGYKLARQALKKKDKMEEESIKEDLRKWFREKWVRYDTKGNIKGPCARDEGEGKPKCRPLASARAMSKDERAKSARRKRREDPVADRPGKGGKPIMVSTHEETLLEKNVPTNPELWARAKSQAKAKFDVYPSAYANGWASKWYKSKGGGWKSAANESVDEACWSGYQAKGMKKKGNKMVPNCVPVEETVDESAAWQRKEGKNPEGGLNRKGIASYRRENPGSKLSMAVTTEPSKLKPGSKAAKRRKSFCARMGGMPGPMKDEKGRPTRKALSLRKWNCEEETQMKESATMAALAAGSALGAAAAPHINKAVGKGLDWLEKKRKQKHQDHYEKKSRKDVKEDNALPQTTQRGIYEKAPRGAKYERMVRHIKDRLGADGLTDKEKGIAFATAWKAKNKEKLDEMDTDAFMRSAPASKNIIDRRPGLSTAGINNAVDTFKSSMKQSEIKDKIHSKYYGTPSTLDKVKSTVSNVGKGMTDVAKGMAGTARDTLGLDMDKPVVNDVAKTAARVLSPVGSAVAKAVFPSNEPKKVDPATYDTSKAYSGLSASERGPISSPGGATPPSISKNPSIPSSMADMGSPSTPDTNFISKMDAETPRGLNSTNSTTPKRIDEISDTLVGRANNAAFWKNRTTSERFREYVRRAQLRDPEEHKKKEKTKKKDVKENMHDKDWDEATGKLPEQHSHVHLNKPDTRKEPGATGITHTIHEETTMENQNLINEAIENILENDLVAMKDNLMTALQEKAQEKLEERKKEIAANYFAQ